MYLACGVDHSVRVLLIPLFNIFLESAYFHLYFLLGIEVVCTLYPAIPLLGISPCLGKLVSVHTVTHRDKTAALILPVKKKEPHKILQQEKVQIIMVHWPNIIVFISGFQTSWSCDLFTVLEIHHLSYQKLKQFLKFNSFKKDNWITCLYYFCFLKKTYFPNQKKKINEKEWHCFTFFKCQICICLFTIFSHNSMHSAFGLPIRINSSWH